MYVIKFYERAGYEPYTFLFQTARDYKEFKKLNKVYTVTFFTLDHWKERNHNLIRQWGEVDIIGE